MEETINQLCNHIKELLQKNDREYIVGQIPCDIAQSPQYYKSIFDTIGDEIIDIADDILCLEMELKIGYSTHEDYGTGQGFTLIAIRVVSGKLVFCIEEDYDVGDGRETERIYEENVDGLMAYESDMVVEALEYYVAILSDDSQYAPCWEV